jgi:hypothetical protein
MSCNCHSQNQHNFNGEIAIHFPGLKGMNKAIVWMFPKLMVCLNCGRAEFVVSEADLRVLREEADKADTA